MSKQINIGQSSSLRPFSLEKFGSNNFNHLRFESKNDVVLFRFLISKIIFTEEILSDLDITALFLSYENCCIKAANDRNFGDKYNGSIFATRTIIQSLQEIKSMQPKDRFQRLEEFREYRGSKMFSPRYYFAIKGQLKRQFNLWIEERFKKKFSPKSFIGKGYNDKGSAKNYSLDGSPNWKEVAMSYREDLVENTTRSEKIERYFLNLRIHKSQIIRKENERK